MWKQIVLLMCCCGFCYAGPLKTKHNISVTHKDEPLITQRSNSAEATDVEEPPQKKVVMSTLTLPSNATSIRTDITDGFKCDGRPYGYYADVENDCQIFHVCLPVTYADGKQNIFRWSFICPEETVFNQDSFTCMRSDDMTFDCADSHNYYDLNRNFGVIDNNMNQYADTLPQQRPTLIMNEGEEPERQIETDSIVAASVQAVSQNMVHDTKYIQGQKSNYSKPIAGKQKVGSNNPLRKKTTSTPIPNLNKRPSLVKSGATAAKTKLSKRPSNYSADTSTTILKTDGKPLQTRYDIYAMRKRPAQPIKSEAANDKYEPFTGTSIFQENVMESELDRPLVEKESTQTITEKANENLKNPVITVEIDSLKLPDIKTKLSNEAELKYKDMVAEVTTPVQESANINVNQAEQHPSNYVEALSSTIVKKVNSESMQQTANTTKEKDVAIVMKTDKAEQIEDISESHSEEVSSIPVSNGNTGQTEDIMSVLLTSNSVKEMSNDNDNTFIEDEKKVNHDAKVSPHEREDPIIADSIALTADEEQIASTLQTPKDVISFNHATVDSQPVKSEEALKAESLITDFLNTLMKAESSNYKPGIQSTIPMEISEGLNDSTDMEDMITSTSNVEKNESTINDSSELSDTMISTLNGEKGKPITLSPQIQRNEMGTTDISALSESTFVTTVDPNLQPQAQENSISYIKTGQSDKDFIKAGFEESRKPIILDQQVPQTTNTASFSMVNNFPNDMYQIPVKVIEASTDHQMHVIPAKITETEPINNHATNNHLSIENIIDLVKEHLDRIPTEVKDIPPQEALQPEKTSENRITVIKEGLETETEDVEALTNVTGEQQGTEPIIVPIYNRIAGSNAIDFESEVIPIPDNDGNVRYHTV